MSDARERYWRSLDEVTERAEVRDALAREFPALAELPPDWYTRRDFMKLLGASLALAGLSGCVDRPREKILPYVRRTPETTPSRVEHYATSMVIDGYATGLLVESHTGRPTKVEGNPDHPASLGAAGVFEQASILGLYDPQRARSVRLDGRRSGWPAFLAGMSETAMRRLAGERGGGLHLLLEPTASPLVAELLAKVRERYPDAHVHFDAPLASDAARTGTTAAVGRPAQPVYDFTAADVVLALDADFLAAMPFHLRHARDFAERRRVRQPGDGMNRLYVIETALTVTGANADHRLRSRSSRVPGLAAAVARRIASGAIPGASRLAAATAQVPSPDEALDAGANAWLDAVAADLVTHPGRCALIAGARQPAFVHALVHLMNAALGNVGRTVRYVEPPLLRGERDTGVAALANALRSGDVGCVMILGGNPAYTAPAELGVAELLARARQSVYAELYRNETADRCRWFVPAQHYLESWGDARAWDGTASVVQPLIRPLYGGHDQTEILAALGGGDREPYTLLRASWQRRMSAGDFEGFWSHALQRGTVPDSAARVVPITPITQAGGVGDLAALWREYAAARPAAADALEITFAPDAAVYDGRFGNNPWLQEFPDPITTLTWGNAALLSARTAARLGVASGELLRVTAGDRHIDIPALVAPGHADDALTIPFGYGRARSGRGEGYERIAAGVGANGYLLRASAGGDSMAASVGRVVTVKGGARRVPLACTQTHWRLAGRPLARTATLDAYRQRPPAEPIRRRELSLYEPAPETGHDQWAMTIDLSTCTGCGACVVACQAENNIPVVGAEGVQRSREMHWLRVDRYFAGTADDPVTIAQPMLCQHCEKAPCEYVCPVNATVHSPDGINEMVYNRCVGTRFCSNNCPYKVRRFNWFDYNAELAETERLAKNPDVTVRARGVMEKCTFCVQRVRRAQIDARLDDRPLRAGEVRTACQQACPTRAIVFGSLTNAEEPVLGWWNHARAYSVLAELGTEPRVRYLERLTNPNPRLARDEDVR